MSWDAVILRLLPAAVATVTSRVMYKYCSLCLESHSSETLLPLLISCHPDNLITQPI